MWAVPGLVGSAQIVMNGVGLQLSNTNHCPELGAGPADIAAHVNVTTGGHARYMGVVMIQPGGLVAANSTISVSLCGTADKSLDTRLFVGAGCPTSWTPFRCMGANDNSSLCGAAPNGRPSPLSAVTVTVPPGWNRTWYSVLVDVLSTSGPVSVTLNYAIGLSSPFPTTSPSPSWSSSCSPSSSCWSSAWRWA